jgi:hypothetical protein
VRIIETVNINTDLDPWLSLEALSKYSWLSVRSLRASLADSARSVPHFRMKEPHVIDTKAGKRRTVPGKILVRRSDFDRWMEAFRYMLDLDKLVDEVVRDLRR